MIKWLRSFMDNGEAAERAQVKEQMDKAISEAQEELKTAQEIRLERLADRYEQIKLRPKRAKR